MKAYNKARELYHFIQAIYGDDKSVGGHGKKVSLATRLKYNLLGFSSKEIVYYNFPQNDYHQYISTAERLKLEDVNGRFAYILGEKVMLERIWGDFIKVPKTYCLIMRNHFFDLLDQTEEFDVISLLKEKGKLLTKPTRSGGGGHGVEAISFINGKFYIGDKEYSEVDFAHELRTYYDYMICDWIYPHEYAKKIFPQTTNTIRLVTIMNHDINKSEVLMAVHRFGTNISIPVDNGCSGGISCFVDVEKGTLSYGHDMIHVGKKYTKHPDTGEQLEGVRIPEWEKVKTKMTHVHNCFPYYEFLAWDVVIAENGDIYIIEINRGMDVHWLQVDRPLRSEPLGRYMREKGLLRNW